ncbi:bifunctional endo-1,4-beta-xylanase XylA-like [Mytilus californianus]|uniref:bifunctional endo-1,4-beta-xylanase XylA-like n=1 Tax=Mytilus californianus TaxID=6549 RepID=UPI0022464B71|nr:bifunctional endo-1,4-beta-xylanase XylA-like [Mytilus californianus]
MGEQAVFVLLFAWFCISVAYPVKRSSDGSHVRKGTNTESVGKGSIGRMGLPENKILTPGKNSLKIKLLETSHLAGSNPVEGMVMPSQNDLGLDNSFSQSTQISEPRATINNKRRHDFDDWDSWESSDEHSHNRENEIRRDHSDWDSWEWDSDEFQTKEKSEKNYDMRGSWTDRDDWIDWDSDISSEEKDNRGKLKIRKLWSNKGKKGAVDDWSDDWDSDRSSEEIDYRRKLKIRKIWSNNGKKGAVDDWDDWDSDISSEEIDYRRKLQTRKIWSNTVKKGTADDWDDDWDSDRSSEEIDYQRKLKIRPILSNNGKKGTFHDQDDWDSEFSDEERDSSYNHRISRTNNGLKRNINYQSDSSDWFDDWSDERFEHSNGNIRKPNIRFFTSKKGYSDDVFGDWTSEQNERTYRKVGRYNKSTFNDDNWSDRSDDNDKDNLYIESDENDLWDNIRDDHNEIRSKNNRLHDIRDKISERVKNALSSDLDDINFNSMPMMSKTMLPKGIKFLGSDNGDT